VVSCGQTDTDRHDEGKSFFPILRKRLKIPAVSSETILTQFHSNHAGCKGDLYRGTIELNFINHR